MSKTTVSTPARVQLGPLRLARTVRVIDRQSGARVDARTLAAAGLGGTAEAVFRAEHADDPDPAVGVREVDQVPVRAVDAGRVGDHSHPSAGERGPTGLHQSIETGPDGKSGQGTGLGGPRYRAGQGRGGSGGSRAGGGE